MDIYYLTIYYLRIKALANDFVVVKVVLDAFYLLIVFMAFSSHKYHIAFLGHHAGRTDSLASVGDADDFLHLFGIESGQYP